MYTSWHISDWVDKITPTLLHADIPETFQEYWDSIDTNGRTEYRKAKKNGFIIVQDMAPPHEDVVAIWNCFTEKQGRPLNKRYNDILLQWHDIEDRWPVADYSIFDDESPHHMRFYSCYSNEGQCVAFLETITSCGVTAVHGTMGHKDFLHFGVMKFLFIHAIQDGITRDSLTKFCYGDPAFLEDNRRHFVKQLLIVN